MFATATQAPQSARQDSNPRHALMVDVLRPTTDYIASRPMPAAATPAKDTIVDRFINKGARLVRDSYVAGKRVVNYDSCRPEYFFDACFDTWATYGELTESIDDDDAELSVIRAIFERAGFGDRLRPTTLRAQVEMQTVAIETARKAKVFLATQQSLAL